MSRHKLSIAELKANVISWQERLAQEEQRVNSEIGAWVRRETGLDTLAEIQLNFNIVPTKNKSQNVASDKKILHTQNSATNDTANSQADMYSIDPNEVPF